jgi:hypothetical protein
MTPTTLPPGSSGAVWRSTCNGIELKLRFEQGMGAWLMIKRPGHERRHVEIPDAEVAATVEQFQAIRGDWEEFKAFVDAVPAVSP